MNEHQLVGSPLAGDGALNSANALPAMPAVDLDSCNPYIAVINSPRPTHGDKRQGLFLPWQIE